MKQLGVPEHIETPLEWGVWIGEIAHNLRSGLDQLLCQLVIRKNPEGGWRLCQQKRTQFPVYLYGPRTTKRSTTSQRFTVARSDNLKALIGHNCLARLKRLQPYHRRNGLKWSPLWLLSELNNADKHNLIIVAGGYGMGVSLYPIVGGTVQFGDERMYREPSTDAEVEAARREKMHVFAEPFHEITFGDGCDAVKNLPVIQTLSRMAGEASRVIESFSADIGQ